jgi:hypothetical protein
MKTGTIVSLLVVLVLLCSGVTFLIRSHRLEARTHFYGGLTNFLESRTRPNETIAYLSSHRSYLFYGKTFDRTVVYLPFRKQEPLAQWIRTLRQNRATLIVVGPLINDGGLTANEIYQRLLQAEKQQQLMRVFGQTLDPRRRTIVYRLMTE